MSDNVKRVKELLKLPQHLCNMCGKCCKIASFKGGLSYEEIKQLAENKAAPPNQSEGARDFLSIFVPYESFDEARKVSSDFVDVFCEKFSKKSNFSLFYCKYLTDNKCSIHEDRPLLCRMYPIPHEKTLYDPECGFKEQGQRNWEEIEKIIKSLEEKMK
jgi:Fe-S-cluster containining protein